MTTDPPAHPGVAYAPQPQNGLSVASMVLGIVGIVFSLGYGFGLFPSIAAVITGHLARKRQPQARGYWLAGLVCGYVGLGISLLWIAGLIIVAVILISTPGLVGTSGFDPGPLSNT